MAHSILLIIGTRPEAIKMAPVVRACQRHEQLDPIICFTGQHREMLRQVADYCEITADVDLDVMRHGQSLAELTSRCLSGIDQQIEQHAPKLVVAQGDTTSVMAASLASFFRHVPFVHVEAGLRSHNLQSPWPEELHRRVAGLTTTLHCAPTEHSRNNLLAEGVPAEAIEVTGNTVVDALLWTLQREHRTDAPWPAKYERLGDRRMVLITGHRRENFDGGLRRTCEAIQRMSREFPDVWFVFPVHLNPQVQSTVSTELSGASNVLLTDPAPYPEFVWLMNRSTLIISDSGGVQEEAPSLRRPVLVTRENTERPEGVVAGAVELVGTDADKIVERVTRLLSDPAEYARRQIDHSPYGDGQASERIVAAMWQRLNQPRERS